MAKLPLKNELVEKILNSNKIIREDIKMIIDSNRLCYAKSEKHIINELKLNLKLYVNWNMEAEKFSFTLILNNNFRIASLDFNKSHGNRHTDGNEWKEKNSVHIHRRTEVCRDTWAYAPERLIGNKIEDNFEMFCKEFNISFEGRFIRPENVQKSLF